jgi:hypothetical protein
MDSITMENLLTHAAEHEISNHWLSFALGLQDVDDLVANEDTIKQLDSDVHFGSQLVSRIFNSWADPLSHPIRHRLRRDSTADDENGSQPDLSDF